MEYSETDIYQGLPRVECIENALRLCAGDLIALASFGYRDSLSGMKRSLRLLCRTGYLII
jgi:hypothetical protein